MRSAPFLYIKQHVVVIIFKGQGIQEEEPRKYGTHMLSRNVGKLLPNMLRNVSEEGRFFSEILRHIAS
jgi:hypothetical protein